MGVFVKANYGNSTRFLPDSNEKADYLTFQQIYQTHNGHDSYAVIVNWLTPIKENYAEEYYSCQVGSINIDQNPVVRWIEGFEVEYSREDLGKNQKANIACLHEERIPIEVAVKRMEDKSGASKQIKIKKLKLEIEKLTNELKEIEK